MRKASSLRQGRTAWRGREPSGDDQGSHSATSTFSAAPEQVVWGLLRCERTVKPSHGEKCRILGSAEPLEVTRFCPCPRGGVEVEGELNSRALRVEEGKESSDACGWSLMATKPKLDARAVLTGWCPPCQAASDSKLKNPFWGSRGLLAMASTMPQCTPNWGDYMEKRQRISCLCRVCKELGWLGIMLWLRASSLDACLNSEIT